MKSEGIHPTLVTYNTLLMGASADRNWAEVANIFRQLLHSGVVPDAITLDCLCGIEVWQCSFTPSRPLLKPPMGLSPETRIS